MFFQLLLVEIFLIAAAGFALGGGNKGILIAGIIISVINLLGNNFPDFWFWEIILLLYCLSGVWVNFLLNRKTEQLRMVKVSAGSAAALLASGLFLPFWPGLFAWTLGIGVPLFFSYREVPKAFYLQIIFKFIFSAGWLMIGNILY
jgi:hypothetical protein